jgi:signal recognition particle GTPase
MNLYHYQQHRVPARENYWKNTNVQSDKPDVESLQMDRARGIIKTMSEREREREREIAAER